MPRKRQIGVNRPHDFSCGFRSSLRFGRGRTNASAATLIRILGLRLDLLLLLFLRGPRLLSVLPRTGRLASG